jgi:hypothetical protein
MNAKRWLAISALFVLVLGPSGVQGQAQQQTQTNSGSTQASSNTTPNASGGSQQAAPPSQSKPHSYTNKAGQRVQSPTKSSSVPAGATAQCRDGSYSFSQNHRGTCSHHGGVASWLK